MAPRFVCAHVRAMDGVAPGEHGTKESTAGAERMIKLNTNENPFPPSPRVLQVVREIEPEMLRRYPDAHVTKFRETAAAALGVAPEMILCGNGCEELLSIAARTFVPADATVASPQPSYPLYGTIAQRLPAKFVGVDWGRNWSLPIEELIATKAAAIFLNNPNDPSGTVVSREQIAKLAKEFDGAIVVDESYVDFAGDDVSVISLVSQHSNLVVTRSFSKSYSLAGLRFGFAIAQESVINQMNKVRDHFNVDSIAPLAAIAALDDRDYAVSNWQNISAERGRVAREVEALGWHVQASHANFLLATIPGGRGRDVHAGLKRQGILVRWFEEKNLEDKIRITIGTSQENNALIGGIKALSASEKAA